MSPPPGDSAYDDRASIEEAVRLGDHRGVIGGLWTEIGELQMSFLKANGLRPSDHLIDIGCGSLRGGVHFAAYLEPHHYWGIDSNLSLLDAAYALEVPAAGLGARLGRDSLVCNEEFDFGLFGREFDVAIAQSLFTHLSANRIRLCLCRLAAALKPGGRLFATYFEAPEDHPWDEPIMHPQGVLTYGFKDPFHYRLSELKDLSDSLPWRLIWSGDWGHPRGQRMAILERVARTTVSGKP